MINKKKFIVTGSSSGIGKSISEFLLEKGAHVIGISKSNFSFKNKNYKHFKFDLSQLYQNYKKIGEIFKDKDIDGLISNAGSTKFDSLENFSPNQIHKLINLNLNSHIYLTKCILPILKTNKSGFLIYIGSEAAYKTGKYGSIYSACKFGLRGFVKSIRQETAKKNIKVTLVNPGIVKTPFYDNLNIEPGANYDEFIEPKDISKVIIDILNLRDGTVIDEINMSSQKYVIKLKNIK